VLVVQVPVPKAKGSPFLDPELFPTRLCSFPFFTVTICPGFVIITFSRRPIFLNYRFFPFRLCRVQNFLSVKGFFFSLSGSGFRPSKRKSHVLLKLQLYFLFPLLGVKVLSFKFFPHLALISLGRRDPLIHPVFDVQAPFF